jgi:choline dehydrogenase-like flavoprotein
MTFDLERQSFPGDTAYDVCVVGAGAVGIVLAVRLLRAGKRVLLVESGGVAFEEASQNLYGTAVTEQPHTGVHTGRFRTWGGTTTRWGGQILPLEPIDFARRSWVPESGWDISREELLPFYAEAIQYEGLGAIPEDDAVWKALGMSAPQLGADFQPYFTRWLQQPNFTKVHGAEMAASPNLTVLIHANLVDVERAADGATIAALHLQSLNGNRARVTAHEFVLTTGAIETSRLLLHLEEKHGAIWNPNGLVGRGFQDHVDCDVVDVEPIDRKRFFTSFTNVLLNGYKYHPKFRLHARPQEEHRILNVAATMSFVDDTEERGAAVKATGKRLLYRQFKDIDGAQIASLLKNFPLLLKQAWAYAVRHRVYVAPDARISMRVHTEQQPDTESRITLSDERDALGIRRTSLRWVITKWELDTIRTFLQLAGDELAKQGLARLKPRIDLTSDEAMRSRCDDGLHHIGGTRMAADPAKSVVDTDLRLRGTNNLFLCSAGVFPTGGYSNPTHTALALALRLGAKLANV